MESIGNASGLSFVFKGDSITKGDYATATTRFATRICTSVGAVEVNQGVSGSGMEMEIADYSCGRDYFHIENVPVKGTSHARIFLNYGTNDIIVNRSELTPANFKKQYLAAVNGIIAKGWQAKDIVLSNGYWIKNLGAAYGSCGVTAARSRSEALLFRNAINEIAILKRCVLLDTYGFLEDKSEYIGGDNLHLNDLGHQNLATFMLNADYTPQQRQPVAPFNCYGRNFTI